MCDIHFYAPLVTHLFSCGWSSDYVLKDIYQYTFDSEAAKAEEKANKYFSRIVDATQNATRILQKKIKKFSEKALTMHRYRCIINVEIKKGSNQNDKE